MEKFNSEKVRIKDNTKDSDKQNLTFKTRQHRDDVLFIFLRIYLLHNKPHKKHGT